MPWADVKEENQVIPQELRSGCFVLSLLPYLSFQCTFELGCWAEAQGSSAGDMNRAISLWAHDSSKQSFAGHNPSFTTDCP